MKLYEYNKEIEKLIDDETGEIKDFEMFEKLSLERNEGIEAIALWVKDLLGDAEKIKTEKNKLAEREKQCTKKAESLKRYLDFLLQGRKFRTERTSISYRKSESVVIDDEDEFFRYVHTHTGTDNLITVKTTPNKKEISTWLNCGNEINGVRIEEKSNIQIK